MKWFLFLAALAMPAIVDAATLTIGVRGADGKPLDGAVLIVDAPVRPAGPIRFPWAYVMAQQGISFRPHVLIVPVGATVTFPNHDAIRHHVYSFSRPKTFELKLYGRDETRSVTFDKPGLIALGCNIHDMMNGFIWVVDTPYAAQTDAGGMVVINGVPAGAVTLRLWHPSIRAPGNILTQAATIPAAGFKTVLSVHAR